METPKTQSKHWQREAGRTCSTGQDQMETLLLEQVSQHINLSVCVMSSGLEQFTGSFSSEQHGGVLKSLKTIPRDFNDHFPEPHALLMKSQIPNLDILLCIVSVTVIPLRLHNTYSSPNYLSFGSSLSQQTCLCGLILCLIRDIWFMCTVLQAPKFVQIQK